MKNRFATIILISSAGLTMLAGCSTMSNLPDKKNVKVSREKPDEKNCKSLGKIEGRTNKINGTQEDALADLQNEAANKGANHLLVEQYSANGQTVTGVAYKCE